MTRFHPARSILVFPIVALLAASAALAQDAGLYEDIANPDASFVRVVDTGSALIMVKATSFQDLKAGVTPYVVIDGDSEVQIVAGDTTATEAVKPATFYSYVVGADGKGVLVTDAITRSPAQADVTFYNLSDVASVDLYAPLAKAVAIGAVAMGSGGSVALKAPLTLDFDVRDGDTVLASVPAVALVRREGVAIVFSGSAGAYTATFTPNELART